MALNLTLALVAGSMKWYRVRDVDHECGPKNGGRNYTKRLTFENASGREPIGNYGLDGYLLKSRFSTSHSQNY